MPRSFVAASRKTRKAERLRIAQGMVDKCLGGEQKKGGRFWKILTSRGR